MPIPRPTVANTLKEPIPTTVTARQLSGFSFTNTVGRANKTSAVDGTNLCAPATYIGSYTAPLLVVSGYALWVPSSFPNTTRL